MKANLDVQARNQHLPTKAKQAGAVSLKGSQAPSGIKSNTPHAVAQKLDQSRTLGTRLTDRDCDLDQIQRIGEFAVYHRTKARRSRGYELVRIRRHAARQTPFGFIGEGERYPTANAWGKDGVSIPDQDEALERLAESVRIGAVASLARMSAIARLRK